MRRVKRQLRSGAHGQGQGELRARLVVEGLGLRPHRQQAPPGRRHVPIAVRARGVAARGVLRNHGQRQGLGQRKGRGGFVEIDQRRRADALDIAAIGRAV